MPTWPDLGALELLVAVADHGSLSAAARRVGMAQPNASRSIGRLERGLRVRLVVRSTTGSTLTPAGVLVVEWARPLLHAAEVLVAGAHGLAAGDGGRLSVAASQTVAEQLLPTWLAQLRARRPATGVDVRVANSTEVAAAVRAGDSDLGFVEGPRAPRGLRTQVVAQDELVLVVGRDHPWSARRGSVTPEELRSTPLLTRESGSGTRVALDSALGAPARPVQELGSNAAVRVAAQSGIAPAVLSRLAVAEALRAGSLLEVPVRGLDLRRQLRAIWSGPGQITGPAADLLAVARGDR